MIRDYLGTGGHPDSVDSGGRTLIQIAARRGHTNICRLLLEAGADPRLADNRGVDALESASISGSAETIAFIRGFGSNLPHHVSPTLGESTEQRDEEIPNMALVEEDQDGYGDYPRPEGTVAGGCWEPVKEVFLSPIDHIDFHNRAAALQSRLTSHRIVDQAEGWSDIEVTLPPHRSTITTAKPKP